MSPRSLASKTARLLPALALGLLMALPAAALLGSAAASPTGSAAGTLLFGASSASGSPLAGGAAVPLVHGTEPAATSALPLAGIPADLRETPWIASLTHQGRRLSPLTSLPNLALLKHPVTANGTVDPFYVAQPAPLGLTDFGLGATPYSYNVSHLMGQVTFDTPPNATDPASTGVIEPSGASDGFVGSVYEFGIQLNTVATNMSIPGSDQGFFWTQNVVDWNDTGIHFVDDTFNLTSATQNPFYIAPGTIYSACHTRGAGIEKILYNYGGVFQCVGGTIPVSPASYPVTIQLYNNASVNAQKRSQVAYGYRIVEAGTHTVYTGVSDTVVFNNPTPWIAPANRPGFSIDAFSGAPSGLFRDAEIDLVGDIGGDNAVFRSINGTMNLEYSNATSGGFRSVPSAYNFGGDTGETSTGIADYWTPSHTLVIHQGPAMLYGLWGAVPGSSVRSGSIHLEGVVHPSYAFVFVSNTPPVLDPWGTGARDNMSWLPTTSTGTFNTYLPPLGAPWTSKYYVQGFADGAAETNGTPVTRSVTSYALTLPHAAGVLRAPLYMFSNAQASGLAFNVTGRVAAPYDFNGLTVDVNMTFNHLNDYGYPTFVLLMAQDVTHAIYVNNTYQGPDSPTGTYYLYDFATPPTGILVPGPDNSTSLPMYTSGIAIYDGTNDRITNQTLAAEVYGLQIVLWQDTNARAYDLTSFLFSSGVWVGDSVGTTVWNVSVFYGGTGITDIGSSGTTGSDLTVVGAPSLGVEGLSSSGGTFSDLLVLNGGTGVSTGENYGPEADYDPYYYLPGTTGLVVRDLRIVDGSLGANVSLSHATTFSGLTVLNGSIGVTFDASPVASASLVRVVNGSTGVQVIDSRSTKVSSVAASLGSTGVEVLQSRGVSAVAIVAKDRSTAVSLSESSRVQVSNVLAKDYSLGVEIHACSGVTLNHIVAKGHSVSVYVY